jgi:hypothetical protein
MRKIRLTEAIAFAAFTAIPSACGIGAYVLGANLIGNTGLRPLFALAAGTIITLAALIFCYRIFIKFRPIPYGELPLNSPEQFNYHIHVLFFLFFFYPITRSGLFPAPFMRAFYLALGAKLGSNTYSQGIIHDPIFVTIGNDSVVGQSALLIPHVIEREHLAHYPIALGNNVTIGANAVVLSDVVIEDDAIVAAGAVVKKGTRIGRGEMWGGVPARRIK